MRIDHIAIYTKNLENLKYFYEKYFNAVSNEKYFNPKTGLETYFLTFEGESRLEIMSRPNLIENQEINLMCGLTHLSFSVKTKAEVDSLTNVLIKDGYKLLSGPRTTGDGYYESCILDPDGNQIELVAE
ncbi:MAG: VOC family protein [Cetobacterium sp.]|uniref:VOC family protein n=1 Tax=Cetobacterium sp. TaxID=2071632 RepID=UPI003F378D0E